MPGADVGGSAIDKADIGGSAIDKSDGADVGMPDSATDIADKSDGAARSADVAAVFPSDEDRREFGRGQCELYIPPSGAGDDAGDEESDTDSSSESDKSGNYDSESGCDTSDMPRADSSDVDDMPKGRVAVLSSMQSEDMDEPPGRMIMFSPSEIRAAHPVAKQEAAVEPVEPAAAIDKSDGSAHDGLRPESVVGPEIEKSTAGYSAVAAAEPLTLECSSSEEAIGHAFMASNKTVHWPPAVGEFAEAPAKEQMLMYSQLHEAFLAMARQAYERLAERDIAQAHLGAALSRLHRQQ